VRLTSFGSFIRHSSLAATLLLATSCGSDSPTEPQVKEWDPPVVGAPFFLGSLPSFNHVREIAYDAKRGVAYFSEPEQSRIAVLSVKPFRWEAPIVLPFEPGGIDMSPGGDSVIVASWTTGELGIIDVRGPTRTFVRHPLSSAQALDRRAFSVRSLSTGKALVTLRPHTWWGCDAGRFVLVDFAAGTEEVLSPDLPCATDEMWLAESGDRSRVAVSMLNSCCPVNYHIFDAATETFGPVIDLSGGAPVTVDNAGDTFLAGNRFIQPVGETVASALVTIDSPDEMVTTMAPRGSEAYFFRGPWLYHIRMRYTGGEEWELTPSWVVYVGNQEGSGYGTPHRIKVLDGKGILLVTTERVHLVAWR
jgi:hypothetical protein